MLQDDRMVDCSLAPLIISCPRDLAYPRLSEVKVSTRYHQSVFKPTSNANNTSPLSSWSRVESTFV